MSLIGNVLKSYDNFGQMPFFSGTLIRTDLAVGQELCYRPCHGAKAQVVALLTITILMIVNHLQLV